MPAISMAGAVTEICYDCAPSGNHKLYQQIITEEKKKLIIERYGSACNFCGYNKCIAALEFHHLDPNDKDDIDIYGNMRKKCSIESLFSELDKCILLCSNCHKELHYNEKRNNGNGYTDVTFP